MLLATYQPLEPDEANQNPEYDCFRDKLGGSYPVFCFPARTADEFLFRSLLAAPCKPEQLIIFETDDYLRFDAVTWNNILTLPRNDTFNDRFEAMFMDVDERFSEYVVRPEKLSHPIEACDIRQAIMDDTFETGDERTGDLIRVLQEQARDTLTKNLTDEKVCAVHGRPDLTAIVCQTVFVSYLGAVVWKIAVGKRGTLIDLIPFLPDKESKTSLLAYERFGELRYKVFDTAEGGSHEEYLQMCDALRSAMGINRRRFLSKFPRNKPCPCMSGRKLKNCHDRDPIELFPFNESQDVTV